MSTKIQINSLAALERLIGGDSETEIEIRNSIVQEFTKKHLKKIADESMDGFKSEIFALCRNEIGSYQAWSTRFRLNEDVQATIKERVKSEFDLFLSKYIQEKLEQINLDDVVAHHVKYALNVKIKDRVNEMVRERLDSIMKGLA